MNKYLKVRRSAQQSHFRRRVFERLGFSLAESEISQLIRDIQSKQATLLLRHSLRNSIWRVSVGSHAIVVVYDEETDVPVTVLTESMWQARSVCNSPIVTTTDDLYSALGDHPAAQVLRNLKKERKR
jgi:hypothetical protein